MSGLLIDANLLLVWVLGLLDEDLIEKHKRTQAYRKEDWDDLRQFVIKFDSIITTPSVLTEVNNLLSFGITGKNRDDLSAMFCKMVTEDFDERYVEAKDIVTDSAFARLGLTDIGIERIAQTKSPSVHVLTDDYQLHNLLLERGVDAYNFNHIRGA